MEYQYSQQVQIELKSWILLFHIAVFCALIIEYELMQGLLGTYGQWATYDAQLITSILHAQNKLKEFQLHCPHAVP